MRPFEFPNEQEPPHDTDLNLINKNSWSVGPPARQLRWTWNPPWRLAAKCRWASCRPSLLSGDRDERDNKRPPGWQLREIAKPAIFQPMSAAASRPRPRPSKCQIHCIFLLWVMYIRTKCIWLTQNEMTWVTWFYSSLPNDRYLLAWVVDHVTSRQLIRSSPASVQGQGPQWVACSGIWHSWNVILLSDN